MVWHCSWEGDIKMPKQTVTSENARLRGGQSAGSEAVTSRWTAKTRKVFTDKMRERADGILASTDSAEDFLKRAGIVNKKGHLARAYR